MGLVWTYQMEIGYLDSFPFFLFSKGSVFIINKHRYVYIWYVYMFIFCPEYVLYMQISRARMEDHKGESSKNFTGSVIFWGVFQKQPAFSNPLGIVAKYLFKTHLNIALKNRSDYFSVTSTMGEQIFKEIELFECPHLL